VRDRQSGTTILASTGDNDPPTNFNRGASFGPAISGNGRFVAFLCTVDPNTGTSRDGVWIRDLQRAHGGGKPGE
jgi:hypothetical protein